MVKGNGKTNGIDHSDEIEDDADDDAPEVSATAPPAAGHNGPSDDLIRDFARQIITRDTEIAEVQDELKSKVGGRRALLKAAKKAGIDRDVLLRIIAERQREDAEVIDEERTYIRYRAILNMPIHQLDLFPAEDTPVAFDADSEAGQKQRLFDADDAGYRAGLGGRMIEDNPHHQAEASDEFTGWRAGYHRGQAHLARGLTQPKSRGRRAAGNNPEDRPAA